jgi:hypothetical protein
MILPTKRLPTDRCLLSVGAQILARITEPKTVSKLWDEVRKTRDNKVGFAPGFAPISFDWFTLSLGFLYTVGAIELDHGRVRRLVRP